MLPVGETSRSDSGGGVSAEECSSQKPFRPTPPTAKHVNFSVGYGIYDVPQPFRSIPFACGADLCFRRDVPQPETAPLCRYATPPLRGDHIGHPQYASRFRYRKREIENTRFSHAVRRQAPYPTKRTSPQPTCFMIHPPAAGGAQWRLANRG